MREAADRLIMEHRLRREEELLKVRLERSVATQDRLRDKSGGWDGVAEVRKWRERSR